MHTEPEYLNHLFVVIIGFGFLYGRKIFFNDLVDAHVIVSNDGKLDKDINELCKEIEDKIDQQLTPVQIIEGADQQVVDIDTPFTKGLYNLKKEVKIIQDDYRIKKSELIASRNKITEGISDHFKNVSLLIALCAFSYLILAALFPHERSNWIAIYSIVFNSIIFFALLRIIFRKKVTQNIQIIKYPILALLIALFAVSKCEVIKEFLILLYTGSPILVQSVLFYCRFYFIDTVFISTVVLLILPWILCFFLHLFNYYHCELSIYFSRQPHLNSLNEYKKYLKTKEKLEKD